MSTPDKKAAQKNSLALLLDDGPEIVPAPAAIAATEDRAGEATGAPVVEPAAQVTPVAVTPKNMPKPSVKAQQRARDDLRMKKPTKKTTLNLDEDLYWLMYDYKFENRTDFTAIVHEAVRDKFSREKFTGRK